ncbi:MAG: flagellar basal body-associated FliL family protein [Sphingomonadales bacterium]|nr:flagellar basal body-associated FliL family protein [Sphingomonadales bacterium]
MAEEEDIEAEDELDGDVTEGLEKKRLSGKKIILFALPVVLLLAGGGGYFMFAGGGEEEHAEAEVEVEEETQLVFIDIPEMLVNLNTGGRKASYLKVTVALEIEQESARLEIEEKLPRVIDNFQIYLRELRLEDLNGSAGMFRLKEELLARVNTAVAPAQVNDVLFKEMIVQ